MLGKIRLILMDILKQTSHTRENLGLLAVLEALERQSQITQRELAKKTGLNLKKVNYCLHKLLEKGYVKFDRIRQNPDKRTYLYILTPDGFRAKSDLTYRFLKFTVDFYGKMEEKLRDTVRQIGRDGGSKIALYGASDVARILLGLTDHEGPEILGIVDENLTGRDYHGVPVIEKQFLSKLVVDGVLITALDDLDSAESELLELGVPEHGIWKLS